MDVRYLGFSRFLAIAESNTGQSGDNLLDNDETRRRALIALHEPIARNPDGEDVYSTIARKAAALEFALIRQRPLNGENILVAHECALEFVWMNGYWFDWTRSGRDTAAIWQAIIDDRDAAQDDLAAWFEECLLPR